MICRKLILSVISILTVSLRVQAAGDEYALFYLQPRDGYWQIFRSDPVGSNVVQLTSSAWDKRSIKPMNGQSRLLTRDNQGALFALDLATTNLSKMPLPGMEVIKDYDFDPANGFLVSTYAENALDNLRIWHIAVTGTVARLLIPDKYLNEMPRWIPGSRSFVFVKTHEGKSRIYSAGLDGSGPVPFLKYDWMTQVDPAPSPDGKLIAFCRDEGTGVALWIAEASGSNPVAVFRAKGLVTEPSWSPDNSWLYFSAWDETCFRVARIHPDGTGFAFITAAGVNCRNPVLMRRGKNP